MYLTAVEEVLSEAARRCGHNGLSTHLPREDQVDELKDLIEWALDSFPPHGINGLRFSKGWFVVVIFFFSMIGTLFWRENY